MKTTKQIETDVGPVRVTTNTDGARVAGPISMKPVTATVTTYQHIKTRFVMAALISVEDAGRRVEDFTLMAPPEPPSFVPRTRPAVSRNGR